MNFIAARAVWMGAAGTFGSKIHHRPARQVDDAEGHRHDRASSMHGVLRHGYIAASRRRRLDRRPACRPAHAHRRVSASAQCQCCDDRAHHRPGQQADLGGGSTRLAGICGGRGSVQLLPAIRRCRRDARRSPAPRTRHPCRGGRHLRQLDALDPAPGDAPPAPVPAVPGMAVPTFAAPVGARSTAEAYLMGMIDAAQGALTAMRLVVAAPPPGAARAQTATQLSWSLRAIGITTKTRWTGKGIKVAVLDTGIDQSHPDFQGRIAAYKNFAVGSSDNDVVEHGTHCAGVIAGAKRPVPRGPSISRSRPRTSSSQATSRRPRRAC